MLPRMLIVELSIMNNGFENSSVNIWLVSTWESLPRLLSNFRLRFPRVIIVWFCISISVINFGGLWSLFAIYNLLHRIYFGCIMSHRYHSKCPITTQKRTAIHPCFQCEQHVWSLWDHLFLWIFPILVFLLPSRTSQWYVCRFHHIYKSSDC